MNFIIPSSAYRYIKYCSYFSAKARGILRSVSGAEPGLFLLRPLVDWQKLKLKPAMVGKLVRAAKEKRLLLTDGQHGVRLHGLTECGFKNNVVNYCFNIKSGISLLSEQIILTNKLANAAGVDDNLYPSILTIHAGEVNGGDKVLALKNLVEVLNTVLPLAKEKKVIVNLENIYDFNGRQFIGAELSDLKKIFASINNNGYLGITFDLAHSLIAYKGDYEKIKKELLEKNLLPLINYLHLSVPTHGYRHKKSADEKNILLRCLGFFGYLLTWQADSHSGLKKLFAVDPKEFNRYLDLVDFLLKNSRVGEPRFNVANLEVGAKAWFTGKGATVGDLEYTLRTMFNLFGE